jgi:hypothetical protein
MNLIESLEQATTDRLTIKRENGRNDMRLGTNAWMILDRLALYETQVPDLLDAYKAMEGELARSVVIGDCTKCKNEWHRFHSTSTEQYDPCYGCFWTKQQDNYELRPEAQAKGESCTCGGELDGCGHMSDCAGQNGGAK